MHLSPLVTPGVGLIFWTAVVFICLLLVLSKLAWKPIVKALAERENSIQEALDAADRAREEMKKLEANNQKAAEEARLERDKMLQEAKKISEKTIQDAQDKANTEYAKIVESAKAEIERQKEAALADVRNQVAEFSLTIAEKLVRKDYSTDESQKQLIQNYLQEMNIN